MSNALDKAVEKIYDQIAETGRIDDNQMALIIMYEKKNKKPKKDTFSQLTNYANKIIKIVNNNLKE